MRRWKARGRTNAEEEDIYLIRVVSLLDVVEDDGLVDFVESDHVRDDFQRALVRFQQEFLLQFENLEAGEKGSPKRCETRRFQMELNRTVSESPHIIKIESGSP